MAGRITKQQQRFVAEFLKDQNATQAAIRAGYSASTASEQGSRLLGAVGVSEAIAAALRPALEAQQGENAVTALRVIEEMRRLAMVDLRSFWSADGKTLKPISEWTPEMGAAASSMEVVIKNVAAGDGQTDTIHKIKLWDKTRALEMLAKNLGLLIEKVDVTVHGDGLEGKVQKARERVKKK